MKAAMLVWALVLTFSLPALSQNQNPVQLPEGPAKEILEAKCVFCHELERVARRDGNTPEGWQLILNNMVTLGALVTPDEVQVLHEYLTANFPNTAPEPVLVPGPVEVTIREWDVPTPGSRPHDPLVARDGTIWYAGINASILGHFDPETERFGEYKLKANTGPHGLIDDAEGNIWFTGQHGHYMGKLDPRTGFVTEYPLSHPDGRSPHTPIVAPNGDVFFTTSGGNMLGRISAKTGEMTMVRQAPNPYGIQLNSEGIPFITLNGTNKLGRLDPVTMEVTEYELPHPDTRPRRLAITSDDAIWYGDYTRGYLGRYDPKTGEHKEWATPSGPDSRIYGIAQFNDVIWYNESGVRPNTIVRFDPQTERFQSWAIPSGGGVVRHMMPDQEGNIWLAESGVNKIGVVEVK